MSEFIVNVTSHSIVPYWSRTNRLTSTFGKREHARGGQWCGGVLDTSGDEIGNYGSTFGLQNRLFYV